MLALLLLPLLLIVLLILLLPLLVLLLLLLLLLRMQLSILNWLCPLRSLRQQQLNSSSISTPLLNRGSPGVHEIDTIVLLCE
jgi:hypothetical protein